LNDAPETQTINTSGSNLAALNAINAGRELFKVRRVKSLSKTLSNQIIGPSNAESG